MAASPVELIIAAKIEDGRSPSPHFLINKRRRGAARHICVGLSTGGSSSLQQNAEPAGGRHGRADNGFLQLLGERGRQIQAEQRRAEAAPQQRAHRLPHVSERSDACGENHERPRLQQRQ